MSENQEQQVYPTDTENFYNSIDWTKGNIQNKISKEDFLRNKARFKKSYVTFLGPADSPYFYMFRPLSWGIYKDIKSKGLDKDVMHEYIVNSCVIWPKLDPIDIAELDSGIMLTLVFQIFATSNFLSNPLDSLNLIYE